MDVFKYFEQDAENITKGLQKTSKNYPTHSEWTWDRTFEETKKELAQIQKHIETEGLLESNLKRNSNGKVLKDAANKRAKIVEAMENIQEIHVDEPGFEEALAVLDERFKDYIAFCNKTYYPFLKSHLNAADMERIEDQLDMSVLS